MNLGKPLYRLTVEPPTEPPREATAEEASQESPVEERPAVGATES
jgi:hypothetical protein